MLDLIVMIKPSLWFYRKHIQQESLTRKNKIVGNTGKFCWCGLYIVLAATVHDLTAVVQLAHGQLQILW
mgnify:CR=1 FL=1